MIFLSVFSFNKEIELYQKYTIVSRIFADTNIPSKNTKIRLVVYNRKTKPSEEYHIAISFLENDNGKKIPLLIT